MNFLPLTVTDFWCVVERASWRNAIAPEKLPINIKVFQEKRGATTINKTTPCPGNPYWRGRLSTVDLLGLTSQDQLLLMQQTLHTFLTKQAILKRKATLLSLPLQLVFSALANDTKPKDTKSNDNVRNGTPHNNISVLLRANVMKLFTAVIYGFSQ
jgi:hypothetical protein